MGKNDSRPVDSERDTGEVRGRDDLDDVHIFRSDEREGAEEVAELMSEDLEDVELIEAEE